MTIDQHATPARVTAAQLPTPEPVTVNGVRVINCNACHINLPETAFAFKNKATGKRNTKCKPCMSDYARANYLANRQSRISAANERNVVVRAEIRAEVAMMLVDVVCGDCSASPSPGNDLIVTLPGDEGTSGRRLSHLIGNGWTLGRIRHLVTGAAASGSVLCRQCLGKRCGSQNRQSIAARARAQAAALGTH